MKEKTLLKISLLSGFIGITLLLLMCKTVEPSARDISLLSEFDDKMLISGNVVNVIEYNNTVSVVIAKTEFINVLVFDKENIDFLSLQDGDVIQAIGKIEDKKGRKQVIADEIRIV
jgi:hypothetical protein